MWGMEDIENAKGLVWLNGEMMDAAEAVISPLNRGVQVGCGVFETLLCVKGEVIGMGLHLERLKDGVNRLGYEIPHVDELVKAVDDVVRANGMEGESTKVRISTMEGMCMVECGSVLVRGESARLLVSEFVRNERSAIAGVKCSSYAENMVALKEGQEEGVDEVLFLNTMGSVCECATANVFWVRDEVVYTPSLETGCLAGVTRELVIELAVEQSLKIEEGEYEVDDLLDADEVFITGTLRGVQGVTHVGCVEIGEIESLGEITQRLRGAYADKYLG